MAEGKTAITKVGNSDGGPWYMHWPHIATLTFRVCCGKYRLINALSRFLFSPAGSMV